MQRIQLTLDGYQRLQQALQREQQRLDEARQVVREQMEANEAESLGLVEAQQALMAIEVRIEDLEDTLARAEVVIGAAAGVVNLGSVVTLREQHSERELKVQLVSPAEATVGGGGVPRVSTESPVGSRVLGRQMGEAFTVLIGTRTVSYVVQHID